MSLRAGALPGTTLFALGATGRALRCDIPPWAGPLLQLRVHEQAAISDRHGQYTRRRLCCCAGSAAEAAAPVHPAARDSIWANPSPEDYSREVEANSQGLQLTFLGTAASHGRHNSRKFCLALRTTRSCLLFDCCEDAQRALLHAQHVRPSRIDRIFISCLDGDQIYGLPGMLCTVSAARERGHEMADVPVHVYGPIGVAEFLDTLLSVSDTHLLMPVVIHEFDTGPPDLEGWPPEERDAWQPAFEGINRRAQLYTCCLPPDQLNPAGYYDGSQTAILQRSRGRRRKGPDERAGTLPLPLPPPGDPAAAGLTVPQMTWTIQSDNDYLVVASPLPHAGLPCLAYTFVEADRSGSLDVEKAVALGLKPGRSFALLKAGQEVQTEAGDTVRSSQVLGPSRRGRRVLVLGDSPQPRGPPAARGADIVVAPASYQGRSIAMEAGAAAAELGASQLILTRHTQPPLSQQQSAREAAHEEVNQAAAVFSGGKVFSAEELGILNLPRYGS